MCVCCSLLLLCVEPEGPGYQIQLQGSVDLADAAPLATVTTGPSHRPIILSNKHYLAWGGVAVGRPL